MPLWCGYYELNVLNPRLVVPISAVSVIEPFVPRPMGKTVDDFTTVGTLGLVSRAAAGV